MADRMAGRLTGGQVKVWRYADRDLDRKLERQVGRQMDHQVGRQAGKKGFTKVLQQLVVQIIKLRNPIYLPKMYFKSILFSLVSEKSF